MNAQPEELRMVAHELRAALKRGDRTSQLLHAAVLADLILGPDQVVEMHDGSHENCRFCEMNRRWERAS